MGRYKEPDNAGNRSLPLARLKALVNEKKFGNARALIASIKVTAANRNLLHLWRGLTYKYASDLERAGVEFDQCTDFTETSPAGQLAIAATYMELDQSAKAVKILDFLLDKCPCLDSSFVEDCYELRADSNAAAGRLTEAIADYRHAVRLCPSKGRLLLSRAAEILRRQHKCSEAVAILNEVGATKDQPGYAPYYLCRAGCFEELGKWSEAAKDFTIAVKIAQEGVKRGELAQQVALTRALMERANCYDHMGKKELATADRIMFKKLAEDAESEGFRQLK
jgi:tetratricopeptide (TPR) repeat protein